MRNLAGWVLGLVLAAMGPAVLAAAQSATTQPPVQTSPSIAAPGPAAASPSVVAPKKKLVKAPAAAPAVVAPAVGAAGRVPTGNGANPVPPIELVVLMMRASIIALDQANKTNNYTVLRAMAGPSLQAHTPEELSKTFALLRDKQIDLSPVLVTKPWMSANPAIEANGYLRLAAIFPTQPLSIACVVEMQPVAGFWRLASISINLAQAEQTSVPAPAGASGYRLT